MNHQRPSSLRPQVAFIVLLLSAFWLLPATFGQSATATLSGEVVDQNGAVIPGALVKIINPATAFGRETTSSDAGAFTFPLLPPGTYQVTAQRDGFSPVRVENVALNVGDRKALQIQLKAGDVNATVTVDSNAETVRTDGSVGTVIDKQFVSNLPLNGRSFQSLLELTPGVTLFRANPNPQGGSQFSVNGQRTAANYFTVDGVSANTGITANFSSIAGQSASGQLPGLTALGSTQSLVSVDALQEFRVETSTYAPEFGRTPGGQVSMLTRSGSNDFHGTLFEYFRNESMDANDWFANATKRHKPPERQNDFGGTFSGPILLPRFGEGGRQPWYNGRNRTFLFFSYEGLRLRLPQVKIVNVPTLALRQQVPAAVGTLLKAFPLPNGIDLGNGLAQFAASYADPSRLDGTALRVDHSISAHLTIFGRYSHTPSFNDTRASSLNSISEAKFENDSITTGVTWLGNAITNDLRVNWTRTKAANFLRADTFGGAVLPPNDVSFPSPLTSDNSYFLVQFSGTSGFATGTGNNYLNRQLNIVDGLSWIKGAHALKFGVDYRRLSPILDRSGGNFSNFSIGSESNARAGVLSFAQIGRGGGENVVLYTNLSAYIQDTWKAAPRLTLTYGLRWELNPPPTSLNGHLPVTIEDIKAPEPVSLAPKNTPLWKTTYTGFAPRLGVAYQLSRAKGRETVLRGGFGVFYDTGFGVSAAGFDHIYPFFASKLIFNVPYPLSAGDAQAPVPGVGPPQQLFVSARNLKLPYSYQWNVAMEQSIGSKQTLSVSWVGAAGHRLLRQEFLNNVLFGEFGGTRVPVSYSNNSGASDYKALQVQFQRRLSRGLQTLVNYTLSKSNDTGSDEVASLPVGAQIDLSREYGPSDFDVRHVFTSGVTYDLPKLSGPRFVRALLNDWGIDGLIRARTAFPLNVRIRTSFPAPVGVAFVRPNIVSGVAPVLIGRQYPGGKALNPAAFSVPAGTVGDSPRNSLRFFPAQQVDLTLRRQFEIKERIKLQFRFEVFNVFNHPNFADPATTLFGQSTPLVATQMLSRGLGGLNALYQMGGPRSGQLAVRVVY